MKPTSDASGRPRPRRPAQRRSTSRASSSRPRRRGGPPFGVLVLGTVLGVIGLVAVIIAWRGNRGALRVAAGA